MELKRVGEVIEVDGIKYIPLEDVSDLKVGVYPSETPLYHAGCGNIYINIGFKDEAKKEIVFIDVLAGKSGTCAESLLRTICELLIVLQKLPQEDKIKALVKASGHLCQYGRNSCGNLVIREILDLVLLGGVKHEQSN